MKSWPLLDVPGTIAFMKLVYTVELDVPDDSLAADIGHMLQGAWSWLRFRGWKVKVVGGLTALTK